MSAARSCNVTFSNTTDALLSRQSWDLLHGIWSENMLPPEQIGSGTPDVPNNVVWQAESQGFLTGTEGSVVYTMLDGTTITIYWDVPYAGENAYSVTVTGPSASAYTYSQTVEGDVYNTFVTFTFKTVPSGSPPQ
jgi:hypothetical protein